MVVYIIHPDQCNISPETILKIFHRLKERWQTKYHLVFLLTASAEFRWPLEPAEKLPRTITAVRVLRVCPEASERLPQGW